MRNYHWATAWDSSRNMQITSMQFKISAICPLKFFEIEGPPPPSKKPKEMTSALGALPPIVPEEMSQEVEIMSSDEEDDQFLLSQVEMIEKSVEYEREIEKIQLQTTNYGAVFYNCTFNNTTFN